MSPRALRRTGAAGRELVAFSPTGLVSGAERVLVRVLGWARDDGWHVSVVAPDGPISSLLDDEGFVHTPIPELKLPDAPRPVGAAISGARSAVAARRLRAAASGADLVVATGLFALPALRLARLRPPVLWLGQDVAAGRGAGAMLRIGRPAVDRVVAVSDAVAEPVRRAGFDVTVVPHGTRWPVEPAVSKPEDPIVVGCVALLTPNKGQLELLEAVARLGRPEISVELVGGRFPKDGPYVARLAARAQQPDLAGRVLIDGPCADPVERIRHWSVATAPSTVAEAGPLTVLEAMSLGVPVVATDAGGPRQYLGDAGILVPPGDVDALGAAIARLVDDADLHRRCGDAGRQRVAAHYTLDHQQAAMTRALRAMVAADSGDVGAALDAPTSGAAVRVGIVSYNTADLLERCLEALLAALAGLDAEIVVVDNASVDDSAARAGRVAGVVVVENSTNVGYARAMNQALAGTDAPVLIALNPDTVAAPGSLRRLVERLGSDDRTALAAPRLVNVDGSDQHSAHRFPSIATAMVMGFVPHRWRGRIGRRFWLEGFARFDEPAQLDWAIGAVHAIRRDALTDPDQPYRERWFMYTEDMDLCWRLRAAGWRVVLEPAAVVSHVGNAAGAVEWGGGRDARWLDGLYDWYVETKGPLAARLWASAQVLGLLVKLPILRRSDPERARDRARLLRIHATKAVRLRRRLSNPAPDTVDGSMLAGCRATLEARSAGDVVVMVGDDHPVVPEFKGQWRGTAVAVGRRRAHEAAPRVPTDFRVVAFVPVYNEADILGRTIDYLAANGLDVHVVDNWSTDGSYEIALERVGSGVVAVERYPADRRADYYDWTGLLTRFEELAREGDADWYVLHDADERRQPPWPELTLREGLWRVQCEGFTAVDHTIVEFHPVDDEFRPGDHLEQHFRHWAPTRVGENRIQRKAWKASPVVALAPSGGHDATFPGRLVHPYNFLLRHYPVRSQRHGEAKVLRDRKPRFTPEELRRGWHDHYAHVRAGHQFIRRPGDLEVFDTSFYGERLLERLSGDFGSPPARHHLASAAIGAANRIGVGRPMRVTRRLYRIARRRSTETGDP